MMQRYDPLDEALDATFPASDPVALSPIVGTGHQDWPKREPASRPRNDVLPSTPPAGERAEEAAGKEGET